MNFVLATLAYLVMGALIGVGLLKATAAGSYALLLVALALFLGLFVKYGCLTSHD